MKRAFLNVAFLGVVVVACQTPSGYGPITVLGGEAQQPPEVAVEIAKSQPVPAGNLFGPAEYLVGDEENYATGGPIYMGKMLTKAAQIEGEAEFLLYYNAEKKWSKHYWRVRPATAADLTLGAKLIAFGGNQQEEIYHLPRGLSSARKDSWWGGAVTDTSLMGPRGIVYVGGYKVHKDNTFAILK